MSWREVPMGEVITIISGKGGTGKTTICAAIATCLAAEKMRVICIDADIGLRNLDIALGMDREQAYISFMDVIRGQYSLADAAAHPRLPELRLLSSPYREGEDEIDFSAFGRLIKQIRREYDFCLIDSPAGIGKGFRLATAFADRSLVIATPDPASLRDAERAADLAGLSGLSEQHLIVNRVDKKLFSRTSWTIDYMMDETGLPLIGLIPEDKNVLMSAIHGVPLIYTTGKGAAEACLRISKRLRQEPAPLLMG
ncbi:MAG: AAA family ATPase [Oscillospiraceae bacterium]|nr:AAA family ATPase [Oscillospiraceae bacterium]